MGLDVAASLAATGGTLTLADALGAGYLVISVASVLILRIVLSNRDKTGSDEFALLVFGIVVMGSATGAQFIADGPRGSAAAWNVLILGADLISIGWLLFTLEFTNRRALPRVVLAVLVLEIVVVQALAWTNPAHHLALSPASSVDAAGFHHEVYGPAFWGHAAVAYVVVGVSIVLMIREFLESSGVRRQQVGVFLGCLGVPLALNVLYVSRLQPIDFTLTPVGFIVTELGFVWALYYAGFLDMVPVARETAIQEMGDAFITLDGENRVVDYNDAAAELFDVDGRAKGLPVAEFFGQYGDTVAPFDEITDVETEITLDRGGERRHYNLSISPVRGGAESGTIHVIVLSDITPVKRRERELRRTTDRLDQFAGVVSHDLRNPLNVAQGRVDLARQDGDSEHLRAACTALDRMEGLIEDLLTLARQGQPIDDLGAVTLSDVVAEDWAVVDTKAATLIVDGDCTFLADVERLRQLFENLFRNALDHGRSDVEIRVGALDDPAGFYVEDDGPGIPGELREHVFDGGYSTAEDGTGFGLAIVREIVEAHGWAVDVTEAADGGARFEITGVEVVPP